MAIIKLGAGHKYKFTSSGSNLQFKEGTDNPLGLTIASGGLQSHGNLEIISGSAIFDGPISASNAIRFTGLGGTYPSAGNVKTMYVQADGTVQLGVIGSGLVDSSSGNIFTSDGNLVSSREIGLGDSNVSFMPGAFNSGTATFFIGGNATYENRIGINTATPTEALQVIGTISASADGYFGGDVFVEGIITADEFHTAIVSTSVQYSTGNSEFGDESTDVHKFTGSIEISGNLTVTDDDSLFGGMVSMSVLSSSLGIAAGGGITAHGDISSSVDSTGSFGAGQFFGRVQMSDKLFIGDNLAYQQSNTNKIMVSESTGNAYIAVGVDDITSRAGISFTTHRATSPTTPGGSSLYKTGSTTNLDTDESFVVRPNGRPAFVVSGNGDIFFQSSSTTTGLGTNYFIADASTKRIGIGTTSPGTNLVVSADNGTQPSFGAATRFAVTQTTNNTGYNAMTVIGGKTTGASLYMFGDVDNEQIGRFTYLHEHNRLDTFVNNAHAMTINSSQNVGIGTKTPISKLDIKTHSNVSGSRISFDSSGSYRPTITMYKWAGGDANHHAWNQNIASDGNLNFAYDSTGPNGAKFDGGTENFDSNVLVLDRSGKVGIGTSSPTAKLDVDGEVSIGGDGTADQARLTFRASDESKRFTIETDLDSTTNNDLLGFRSTTTDNVLVLKGDGKVGIGTATPGATLHVMGIVSTSNDIVIESGDPTIHFKDTDGAYQGHVGVANTLMELRTDQNDVDIEIRTNQFDNAIYIDDSTQKIGIGTATPDSTLTVQGDISASGTIYAAKFESSGSDTSILVVDDMQITGSISVQGSGSFGSATASLDGLLVSGTLNIINQDGPTAFVKTKVGSFDEYHIRNDQNAFQLYNATDDRKEFVADGAGGIGIGVATPKANGFALQVSGAIGTFGDNEHALGTKAVRFSDVFAVQTTVGAIFETGLTTEGIGELKTGTVVVWNDGKLIESYKAEDSMVMGIIKQGKDEPIILGAEPLLVTGKVNEGDFLITSDKLGHAKASPTGYLLKMGTVIAQALESSEGESNLIKGMIRKL